MIFVSWSARCLEQGERIGALYCTVLYCTVLYCTALYCTVQYCTVLYCTVLYCTVSSDAGLTNALPRCLLVPALAPLPLTL